MCKKSIKTLVAKNAVPVGPSATACGSGSCISSTLPATIVSTTAAQTAAQFPRVCEVLLRKDLSDTQKVEIMLNVATFSPPSSCEFPSIASQLHTCFEFSLTDCEFAARS